MGALHSSGSGFSCCRGVAGFFVAVRKWWVLILVALAPSVVYGDATTPVLICVNDGSVAVPSATAIGGGDQLKLQSTCGGSWWQFVTVAGLAPGASAVGWTQWGSTFSSCPTATMGPVPTDTAGLLVIDSLTGPVTDGAGSPDWTCNFHWVPAACSTNVVLVVNNPSPNYGLAVWALNGVVGGTQWCPGGQSATFYINNLPCSEVSELQDGITYNDDAPSLTNAFPGTVTSTNSLAGTNADSTWNGPTNMFTPPNQQSNQNPPTNNIYYGTNVVYGPNNPAGLALDSTLRSVGGTLHQDNQNTLQGLQQIDSDIKGLTNGSGQSLTNYALESTQTKHLNATVGISNLLSNWGSYSNAASPDTNWGNYLQTTSGLEGSYVDAGVPTNFAGVQSTSDSLSTQSGLSTQEGAFTSLLGAITDWSSGVPDTYPSVSMTFDFGSVGLPGGVMDLDPLHSTWGPDLFALAKSIFGWLIILAYFGKVLEEGWKAVMVIIGTASISPQAVRTVIKNTGTSGLPGNPIT